jgi:hypothetical protein
MRVGRFVSAVLVTAGVVVVSCGFVLTDGNADDGDPPPSTLEPVPSSDGDAGDTSTSETLPSSSPPSIEPTTLVPASDASPTSSSLGTSTTPTTTGGADDFAATTSIDPTTASALALPTTTTTVQTRAAAPQLPATIYLRGLCAIGPPPVFVFAVSNLGTATVTVQLVSNGSVVRTLTLPPGQMTGFTTTTAGTVAAVVGGATVALSASSSVPCPGSAGIGLGGLCRDPVAGYEWILGNAGTAPVDVEIRLGGTQVGIFTVPSQGFAGFTTVRAGRAEAFVDGVLVTRAFSSDQPCVPSPIDLGGECFEPGEGYRWVVSNNSDTPLTVEFVVAGVSQGLVRVPAGDFVQLTTQSAGRGEVLLDGRVVASASSDPRSCHPIIDLQATCADEASGTVWLLLIASSEPVEVRLVLDGTPLKTVTFGPDDDSLSVTTPPGRILQAFVGDVLDAWAESSTDPCVRIDAVCSDAVDGHVWSLTPRRDVTAELRVGTTMVGAFPLTVEEFPARQAASNATGIGQVLIDGVVVDVAVASNAPCVQLSAECADAAEGYLFGLFNRRNVAAHAEVRMDGATIAEVDLGPGDIREVVAPHAGIAQLYLHGELAAEVPTTTGGCETAVWAYPWCTAGGGYYWSVDSNRGFELSVELRQGGHRVGTLLLQPFDSTLVVSRDGRELQAVVHGAVVAQAPPPTYPCEFTPEDAIVLAAEDAATTGGATLPVTGGRGDGLIPIGVLLLASGVTLLVATRRRAAH